MARGGADDTIVALSSGRPPAAIAVVRVSGPLALEAGAALAGPLGAPRTAHLRRLRDPTDLTPIDHALIVYFTAPDTATGENIVEFQCHGGKAVVAALIAALTAIDGLREAEPGEFTRRALINGKIDLTQAEGLAELLEAETEAQRRSALRRSEGALRVEIERWRGELLDLSAELEVAIDYSDEDDGAAQSGEAARDARIRAIGAGIDALLAAPRVEKLRDGVRVVVAGPPNSGKSSLVNALAGEQRAIVTAIPGTTRDRIEVPLALDGLPLVLVDTAGLRDSEDPVERIGIGLARDELDEADVVLWLGDVGEMPQRAMLIAAKCDLGLTGRPGLAVSAASGAGLPALKQAIARAASDVIPHSTQLAINDREAALLAEAGEALRAAILAAETIIVAEEIRGARVAFDCLLGRSGVDDLLNSLFGRFCLGK